MSQTIYFDLETGGVQPHHPNIQIAAIAVDDATGSELSKLECKIKFDTSECDPEALKLNGYTPEAWKDAFSVALAVATFTKWSEPFRCVPMVSKRNGKPYSVAKLAGHNVSTFDLPRLKAMYGDHFFPFSYFAKDTLQRALWYFDEYPAIARPESLKLGVLCKHFGIDTAGAHDALADVRMAAALARVFRMSVPTEACR
jgi:DNA polymerase III epsilon subunit-like protein